MIPIWLIFIIIAAIIIDFYFDKNPGYLGDVRRAFMVMFLLLILLVQSHVIVTFIYGVVTR